MKLHEEKASDNMEIINLFFVKLMHEICPKCKMKYSVRILVGIIVYFCIESNVSLRGSVVCFTVISRSRISMVTFCCLLQERLP